MNEAYYQSKLIKHAKDAGGMALKVSAMWRAGVPDLVCILDGCTVFIEVKMPGNKPSPLQLAMFKKMHAAGAAVYVLTLKKDLKSCSVSDITWYPAIEAEVPLYEAIGVIAKRVKKLMEV